MISRAFITEWRRAAPWVEDAQVEQDLVISRSLVEIFSHSSVSENLAFRGGTALFKLHLPAARYSEDIDLVQIVPGAIGPVLSALRSGLDGWLGRPKRDFSEGRVTLLYRFSSEGSPPTPLKLKIEINTREHVALHGIEPRPFKVHSSWFTGEAMVPTFGLDELLATKLRALYQRKKGRDAFDLWYALSNGRVLPERIVRATLRYLGAEGHSVSRAEFEENLFAKQADPRFRQDIGKLLVPGLTFDIDEAIAVIRDRLVARFPGDEWKGTLKEPSQE